MILEIYKLISLSNLFVYTGYNTSDSKYYNFCISEWRNDSEELYKHLTKNNVIQVGFNNESYHYPLEDYFISIYNTYSSSNGRTISEILYRKSQELLLSEYNSISDKLKKIKQIDLFKIWHFNNKARATSLKQLEVTMRMKDVRAMPLTHSYYCIKGDEEIAIQYNENDVSCIYQLLKTTIGNTDNPLYKDKNKIALRRTLQKRFKVNCLNLADTTMGERLLLRLYAQAVNENFFDIKKLRTYRKEIKLSECIPKWCDIKSKEFKGLIDILNKTTITTIDDELEYAINFHDYILNFGLGGTHGCCKSGIYESNDEYIIVDNDINSLYPSLIKSLMLYPEHFGPKFNRIYSLFVDIRLNEKNKLEGKRDEVLIEGFKQILNSAYGKSNDEKSALYDPLLRCKVAIAGQIFTCMWIERLYDNIPDIKLLQVNTDGITMMIPRSKIDVLHSVNKELTDITSLTMSEDYYKKMIIKDVNNYIAIYDDYTPENDHVKLRGCFEINKELHKDPSMRVVAMALKNYFVNNIPIKDTIYNDHDIFDFCLLLKMKGDSTAYYKYFDDDYQIKQDELSRITRYYISNKKGSGVLIKRTDEGRETAVNIGSSCILFNKYEEKKFDDYEVDYLFYIKEANKIKDSVVDNQLYLFE